MTTHPTSGAAYLHRVIDDFERRERGIPQAHIAAALVTELRAALTAQAISAEPAAHVQNPAEIEHVAGDVSKAGPKSNMAQQPSPTPQADSHPAPALDEREAFELWARPRGLQLRRNEALGHYGNIDTQRCWEGWQARAPADSVTAPAATPTAASIAWTALRDLTDPLGEAGVKIMGHVRIFAQRQYEAGRDEVRPAPPAMDGGEDAERWEFRWLNPANKQNVAPSELAWKTVNSKGMRSEKEVLEDLKTYRYQGKPVYELRPLFATRALQKPEIRCPVRLANGGDCPRHNLQCGLP